ncbi:MAG: PSD1 and planctomycete cytochrome C domain-containing protein [Planctomycetaceae bacterium]
MFAFVASAAMGDDGPVIATKPQPAPVAASDPRFFETNVQPILAARCFQCHGQDTHKAELTLATPEGIRKGSESGAVIEPGKPDESLLYEMVHTRAMPPEGQQPLTTDEIETIREWIAAGATISASGHSTQITQHDVLPFVYLSCTACHGGRRREADLDLRTKASMLRGGKSGPAIVLGKPEESLIVKRIHAGEMPPPRQIVSVSLKPMEAPEVELLTAWIRQGAPEVDYNPDVASTEPDPLVTDKDRQHWSFRPPRQAPVPELEGESSNPIDAFVLQKLRQHNLSLGPEADRRTLIRRATFDLTGLPPSPENVERFVSDADPLAYEHLIDRLLSSPLYGERWARVWLDVAGYSDSEGIQHADLVRPEAYRYRDYVIRAFNADKPYDRFLLEQIAGDELADYETAPVITEELADNLIATAFLRLAADGTYSNITGFVPDRLKVIDDEIEILGSSVMGLTIKCARCHSHKFDPIPQRDYYRLTAVLKGAFDEHDWLKPQRQPGPPSANDRLLPHVPTAERQAWQRHEQQLTTEIDGLKSALAKRTEESTATAVEKRIGELPQSLHDDLRRLLATPAEKRDEVQKYLAEKFEKHLRISPEELKKIDAEFAKFAEQTEAELKRLEARRQPEPLIRALWDRGEPSPTYVLRRGNHKLPGRLVGPGVPSVLTDGHTPFVTQPPCSGAKKTGRRLALARWLTAPEHPLTARVIVNRIWKQHFGIGIVPTLDNFGRVGAPPSHPELLDWLAVDFVRGGWSLKRLHRLMMISQTYRQSSQVTSEREKRDPENRLFSRMLLRRLEAEMLSDTLLAVTGRLDERPFGQCDPVSTRPDGLVTSVGSERGWRRSIYVLQRRSEVPTILVNFDLPAMSPNCIQRTESIVAPQALHLMNNGMVHELADHFARRVQREAGDQVEAQIDRIYQLAISRRPSEEERLSSRKAISDLTQQWRATLDQQVKQSVPSAPTGSLDDEARHRALANFCHAILNLAEFLYVD